MSNLYKYPRTPHLPWSPGASNDDRILANVDHFKGKEVVVTVKMDGENTTLYRDAIHARSLDSKNHPSRSKLKAEWANRIRWDIPEGWRYCLENCTAKHSIHYKNLVSLWFGLSVWNDQNVCLEWDETWTMFAIADIQTPRTLYEGTFDEELIKKLDTTGQEGYVVRLSESFKYEDFGMSVAKYVRPGHVQTNQHWQQGFFVENLLTDE